ncbi:MAG: hypothetical protein MJ087_04950 [Lachnospiraceae bacterium]|nr:hypothetical protein [Lachnospiraceae bacterium]
MFRMKKAILALTLSAALLLEPAAATMTMAAEQEDAVEEVMDEVTEVMEVAQEATSMDLPEESEEPEEPEKPEVNPPLAATAVKTAGQSNTKVKISWKGAENATYYMIYRKKGDGSYSCIDKKVTGTSYTDSAIKYGYSYTYKIVSYYSDDTQTLKGGSVTKAYKNKKIVSQSDSKYSYGDMKTDILELCEKYDGMVTYEVIGKSVDKRNIYDVILGNPKAKKSMLVIGTQHAREYMATVVIMNQLEAYLQAYNGKVNDTSVSKTLDHICIHFVPMSNPDGVTISQYGISKINNKTLRANLKKITKGKSTRTWKANARGVDLNRNWGYKWKKQGKKSASGYSGPSVHSEPETKALVKLKKELKADGTLKGIVNYHTMGNIVFGKCTKKSIKDRTTKMYKLAKGMTKYGCGDTLYGGTGIGNSREYDMYTLGVASITLEVGRKAAPGPISEFKAIFKKNKNLVIREAMILD